MVLANFTVLHCFLSCEQNNFVDCHLFSGLRGLEENPRTMGCHVYPVNIILMHLGSMIQHMLDLNYATPQTLTPNCNPF